MFVNPSPDTGPSLLFIEGCFTMTVFALAFALPRVGSSWFSRVEKTFSRIARKKILSVVLVGASAFLLRLAILPICPIPLPFVQDDYSFLLAANTFALGRLTNPTPALWTHFESIQITLQPTYMSMYFPAQGLILAAGKVLFGHAWFGLLCVTALMCAALCWMLQAWLPPAWALLGGILAVLRIGLFSYWINTYSGGGSIAALGAALLLGALPRFLRAPRLRYSMLMAIGLSILALSRPFEGLLLCVPIGFVLLRWALFRSGRPSLAFLLRYSALPLAVIFAALAWLGYYDARAFGNALTLPYSVDRAQYAAAPYWIWESPRPEPAYRHKALHDFYINVELAYAKRLHTVPGFLTETLLAKPGRTLLFFAGIALLPPLLMLRRIFLDRRIRFLLVCVILVCTGVALETWLIPHYFAAITPAFYALGLQSLRHLRQWKPGGQPVGAALVRFTVLNCVALAAVRLAAQPLHLVLAPWPSAAWASTWAGPGQLGLPRALVEKRLNNTPGNKLVIVRYGPNHSPLDEWVYNAPDLDRAAVIWARDMNAAANDELIRLYKNRSVWLVQPDENPAGLEPFSSSPR
jgi:hypothetical protein